MQYLQVSMPMALYELYAVFKKYLSGIYIHISLLVSLAIKVEVSCCS